jgi:hypothetical protein
VRLAVPDWSGSATLFAVTVTPWKDEITAGALYSPLFEIEPNPGGSIAQVTALFVAFATVAENCTVSFCAKVGRGGSTVTATGNRKMEAIAVFELSARLVAVRVTTCWAAITSGAVYKPVALMVPVPAGLSAQTTPVFVDPVTEAVNCCVAPCDNVTLAGDRERLSGGFNVTVAVAVLVPSAALVAVTVTVCCVETLAGAVYKPAALIVPAPVGLIVHVTVVFEDPVTVGVNCWVAPWDSDTVEGVTDTLTGGFNVTVAVAVLVPSAALVAVTVTVCCAVTLAGAV